MTRVRRSLICFVPRSGSTHLCALLASAAVLGRPREYFWAPNDGVANPELHDWDTWLASTGVEPHDVTYEQLLADPRAAVAGIARAAGVTLPGDVELRPFPGWERQSDTLNEEWAQRFRRDAA